MPHLALEAWDFVSLYKSLSYIVLKIFPSAQTSLLIACYDSPHATAHAFQFDLYMQYIEHGLLGKISKKVPTSTVEDIGSATGSSQSRTYLDRDFGGCFLPGLAYFGHTIHWCSIR